jgi:hypothetical protein
MTTILGTASATLTIHPWSPPAPGTYMYIDDYEFYDSANLSCTTDFNVTIGVSNVTDLKGFEFKLYWNTTLLSANRVYATSISQGAAKWLPVPGPGEEFVWDGPPTINNTIGQVWVYSWNFPQFNGTGGIMKVEFHIEYAPPQIEVTVPTNKSVSCDLDLLGTDCYLYDTMSDEIPMSVQDGFYEYIRPQKLVGAPTAYFTVNPTTVYVGETTTLDAHFGESPGSDDGGAPPLYYAWDFGSDGTYEINATDKEVVIVDCPTAGTFNVTLTVTNNIEMSDSYGPLSWTVQEKLGAIIDIYTSTNRWCGVDTDPDNVGKGADAPCDALSPDVNVTLFAEVTYNGAPVNHVLVSFEVRWMYNISWCEYDPQGEWDLVDECVLFRTAETDKDGIARIWFRVPTPCDGMMFGKWKAWGKAKVQEVPIEDTMEFDVGYLVTMCSLEILDPYPDAFIREDSCLNVEITFKSISWIPRSVKFFVVVYDECDVPLGQAWVTIQTEPAEYCSPTSGNVSLDACIPIPQWAYVGYGKVYASAFTDFPHACGQAYCPELSVTEGFYIDWQP